MYWAWAWGEGRGGIVTGSRYPSMNLKCFLSQPSGGEGYKCRGGCMPLSQGPTGGAGGPGGGRGRRQRWDAGCGWAVASCLGAVGCLLFRNLPVSRSQWQNGEQRQRWWFQTHGMVGSHGVWQVTTVQRSGRPGGKWRCRVSWGSVRGGRRVQTWRFRPVSGRRSAAVAEPCLKRQYVAALLVCPV